MTAPPDDDLAASITALSASVRQVRRRRSDPTATERVKRWRQRQNAGVLVLPQEIDEELENKEDNLLFGQLSKADQRLRTFRKEMDQVYQVKTLAAVRELAEERAKVTRNPELLTKARAVGNDIGAIKRLLLDDILRERNIYAETVIKDVDQRRQEMRATGAKP